MQLRLARDVKSNMKLFYYYISTKRLNKENMSLLLNEADDLVRVDRDETDILIVFFASVFTKKVSQASMLIERVQEGKNNQQQIRIQSWSTWEFLTYVSPWDQMGCIQGSGDNWLGVSGQPDGLKNMTG